MLKGMRPEIDVELTLEILEELQYIDDYCVTTSHYYIGDKTIPLLHVTLGIPSHPPAYTLNLQTLTPTKNSPDQRPLSPGLVERIKKNVKFNFPTRLQKRTEKLLQSFGKPSPAAQ